ncbi:hypothetical protein BOX15_Mlig019053g1 [Macrostomum lignano]|uniref:Uncharacterized protein n=1 Tax=Macrostomum lignano TaxID=282301 RepID=A0A267EDK0_9PLAT|nr:hypothetical protein BOX15_Mlig019053g1 [Macrostomum lignano]
MSAITREEQQARRRDDAWQSAQHRYQIVSKAARDANKQTKDLLIILQETESHRAQLSTEQLNLVRSLLTASNSLSSSSRACFNLAEDFATPLAADVSDGEYFDRNFLLQKQCREKAQAFLNDHRELISAKEAFLRCLNNGRLLLSQNPRDVYRTIGGVALLAGGCIGFADRIINGIIAFTGGCLVLKDRYSN